MKPRIETLAEKKLIGKRMTMSFSDNKTSELWASFMPRRKEIQNNIGTELYSIEVYAPFYWNNFDPAAEFEKWAAVEVTDFQAIPNEMETMTLPDGRYVVFVHKGSASTAPKTYEYIYRTWLPDSDFLLDNRPHFAVMGDKYKNEDPTSEEEIWIPIKPNWRRKLKRRWGWRQRPETGGLSAKLWRWRKSTANNFHCLCYF